VEWGRHFGRPDLRKVPDYVVDADGGQAGKLAEIRISSCFLSPAGIKARSVRRLCCAAIFVFGSLSAVFRLQADSMRQAFGV
jgi:membrane-associated PAP2 superfamily phosphatase